MNVVGLEILGFPSDWLTSPAVLISSDGREEV